MGEQGDPLAHLLPQVPSDDAARLDRLLAELETLPIAELLVAATDLRLPRPLNAARQSQFRQAMAAGQAITKIMSYLYMLREIDKTRRKVGRHVHALLHTSATQRDRDVIAAVEADVQATFYSGVQEVTFHQFVVCVMAIAKLMPLAAKSVGHKIPAEDRAVLNAYKPLRDYFEHIEERLIGKTHAAESVKESSDGREWRVVAGFDVDDQGRIVINDKPIDVTSRGIAAIDGVVQRFYVGLKQSALAQVRAYFSQHPDLIPDPGQPLYKPLVSVFTGPLA
jgi:hypothetical protein